MEDNFWQILAKLNGEKNYDGIIQFASPAAKRPGSDKARYCLAMAYVAKGDKTTGLKLLQTMIVQPPGANKDDKQHKLFMHRIILQTVELAELSLHGGDTIGKHTLGLVEKAERFGRKIKDADLEQGAEDILKRWVHTNSSKQSIVSLIPDSPLTLQVEPTNVCNLSCTMCPRGKMTRQAGFMEPEIFDEMLGGWKNRVLAKELRHLIFGTALPVFKRGSIKLFFMGEPLLHKQLGKLIESGNRAGCLVGLQTNGVALANKKVRESLLAARPSVVGVSLDGMDERSYQSVRQGAHWPDIRKGLEDFYKERGEMNLEKKILVVVSSIIPEWNQTSLERAQKFLEPIRPFVNKIGFVPLSRERDPEFYNEDGEIALYAKQSADSTAKPPPLCSEPFAKLNVLWDGSITPCCYDIDGEMPLGHVRDGIDNVWGSGKAKKLREALLNHDFTKHPLCSACMGNNKGNF
jgi:radical SAM protein with 4Fe4S-binding SPASM domain